MTLATMADRTLPLAERLRAAVFIALRMYPERDEEYDIALTELLADVAAADRLARAGDSWFLASSAYACCESSEVKAAKATLDTASVEYIVAVDAYRARMAHGVGDG